MLINKFAYGSPTAKLIKKSPKWKLDLQVSDHFAYSNEEAYWNRYTSNYELKWLTNMIKEETAEKHSQTIKWYGRYLRKHFEEEPRYFENNN
jgi:hypothetical protein